jgi:dTDP-4-dehydrorhamnose reductase
MYSFYRFGSIIINLKSIKMYIHPKKPAEIEVWGGLECTINRVGNEYFDQLEYSGHYKRGIYDINLIAALGIKVLRYPVLWERHEQMAYSAKAWSFTERNLNHLHKLGITPIAGLVHHGSGPRHVNFFDGSFENGLAAYAGAVATKFPWLEHYTPVNEPLTTARFCGLYGHWYPHGKDDYTFYKILLSECKATVMAMKAIRTINKNAKLIQTEDLAKCYSTPLLSYQAYFENERRWLSYDLLCGKVNRTHYMWHELIKTGIKEDELLYFTDHPCIPHIAGFNYYITSERFLSENLSEFPEHYHGTNNVHWYADVATDLVQMEEPCGPAVLLKEAWEHLQLPLAITECHLNSSCENQIKWINFVLHYIKKLKKEGIDIRALTIWALLGSYGWNCLVTRPNGCYERGIFDVTSGFPQPTALAKAVQDLIKHKKHFHIELDTEALLQPDFEI